MGPKGSAPSDACRICGNATGNVPFRFREMYFGLRDEFDYFECAACGCLQIREIPADPAKYYPGDYYSLREEIFLHRGRLREFLLRLKWRTKRFLFTRPRLLSVVERIRGKRLQYPFRKDWLAESGLGMDARILDVGCGTGKILNELREYGFRNLAGIDPYIASDIDYGNGVRIHKKSLAETEGRFDFILLNHSFEHMADPREAMSRLSRLTVPGGWVVVTLPVIPCHAWNVYRENWVALDPPRHLYIHTRKSMEHLARGAGFAIGFAAWNSNSFQFIGSEQYKRDIPMTAKDSWFVNRGESMFRRKDLRRFEFLAKELDERGEGDICSFYLRKGG